MRLQMLSVSRHADVVINGQNKWELRNSGQGLYAEFNCRDRDSILKACDQVMIFLMEEINKILRYFGHK